VFLIGVVLSKHPFSYIKTQLEDAKTESTDQRIEEITPVKHRPPG
jgi:hypothetical protein